jgi:hypothetical protein
MGNQRLRTRPPAWRLIQRRRAAFQHVLTTSMPEIPTEDVPLQVLSTLKMYFSQRLQSRPRQSMLDG